MLQCVSVLGIHSMSLGADPLEELAALEAAPAPTLTPKGTRPMQFLDDSLLPGTSSRWSSRSRLAGRVPARRFRRHPVTMAEQVQKAVDCWNAGATVLYVHVREADGKGSKRLSMFNEMLARLREACPMLLQVGGSISFAPEGEGGDAVAGRRHAPHAGRAGSRSPTR